MKLMTHTGVSVRQSTTSVVISAFMALMFAIPSLAHNNPTFREDLILSIAVSGSEERYWDIEAARECLDPTDLPDDGWWTRLSLVFEGSPTFAEDLLTPTGAVFTGSQLIEIYNGTPELDAFVRWALFRFTHAGLDIPPVSTIRNGRGTS